MEAVKEGRLIIVRVPLEGGGRLVVSVNDAEARELHDALEGVVAVAKECRVPVKTKKNGCASSRSFVLIGR